MRQLFNTVGELAEYFRQHPEEIKKKTPWKVSISGETKYVLSGNSDQAIAALARQQGAVVESVSLGILLLVS